MNVTDWVVHQMALRIVTTAAPPTPVGTDAVGTYLTSYVDPVELARSLVAAAISSRLSDTAISYEHIVTLGTIKSALTAQSAHWSSSCPGMSIPLSNTTLKHSPPKIEISGKDAVGAI
jgi:hypothetical protein